MRKQSKMSQQAREKQFYASLIKLNAAAKTGTFYLMNTSQNRNGWGVTAQALDEALPTLKGKPIGMGQGYKLGHFPDKDSMDSGKFTSYENKGNYALGDASIEDEKTLTMMKNGEAAAVSVVIHVYAIKCSQCGKTFNMEDDIQAHQCIKDGKAYEQVTSFAFKRVDFVDVPAYPQAGLMDMNASSQQQEPFTLYASFYEAQAVKTEPFKEVNHKMAENPQEKRIADLEASLQKAAADLKEAEKKAATNETETKELKAELDKIKAAQHEQLVNEAYEARKQAGISGEEQVERKMLTAQDDSVLKIMKSDAEKTASIVEKSAKTAPKVRYETNTSTELEAAVKNMQATLGFKTETKEA
jgi:hypothetical protein